MIELYNQIGVRLIQHINCYSIFEETDSVYWFGKETFTCYFNI